MSKYNALVLFGLIYSFALSSALSDPFYYDTHYDPYVPDLPQQPYQHLSAAYAPASPPPAHPVSQPGPSYVVATQFHAQDEFGNVNFGYSNENSAQEESRDEYGNVVGSYSYVDPSGQTRHVSYVADEGGFRVTSSNNLPEETPEVASAKAVHFEAHQSRGGYLGYY
eukprot:TRINITY_DN7273_c0_g1_i1.p1 TRINITY_DN7273_c0_g1~~TRINITY_DN7273_c0_g1_i1.p1  ORF type:complete len:167 (-),score=29.99 TRINITY_DN7273_c0_g1_i1:39-539(-)